jgi:virginiamycin B lyase
MSRFTRLAPVISTFAAALALGAAAPQSAPAAVYWGGNGFVGAANADGSMPIISYPYEIANVGRKESVCGVAVNATDLYWADQLAGTIGTMALGGSVTDLLDWTKERVPTDNALVSGLAGPCGVAVNATHLYWADRAGNAIGRANRDGTDVDRSLIGGLQAPCGIAVDSDHLYWADPRAGTIGRARLDGSEVEPQFAIGAEVPCGVAVDDDHIYWSDPGAETIGRADIDGSDSDPDWIFAGGWACGVAVDASHIFWGYQFSGNGTMVARANLDGSEPRPLVVDQYATSCGAAVDGRVFRPPPPPSSRPVQFGRVKLLRRGRLLVLPVTVPSRGELSVTLPRRIGWSLDKGPQPPEGLQGSLRWRLRLWPGHGKVGKRIRLQLARGMRAPIQISVSYEETGRTATLAEKSIAFGLPRKPRS